METVNIQCRLCGETKQVLVDPNDLHRWKSGEGYIQDLLSYLSPADRELLISATCGECFERCCDGMDWGLEHGLFGPGEDDDESVFEEDEDVYDEDDDEIWEDGDEEADLLDLTQTQQNVMAEICSIVSSFIMDSDPSPSEEAYAELGEKISLAADGYSAQFFGNLYDLFHRSGKNK